MNAITLSLAAVLATGCVSAPAPSMPPSTWLDRVEVRSGYSYTTAPGAAVFCATYGRVCASIAEAQQLGVPRTELQRITAAEPLSPNLHDLLSNVIEAVYRNPAMAADPQAFGAANTAICERHLQ